MDQILLAQDFANAVSRDWCEMDTKTLDDTVNCMFYDPPIAKPWINDHFLPLITNIEEKGLTGMQVAELYHGSSSVLRGLMTFDLLMAKYCVLGEETYMRIFNFYAKPLQTLCPEDPFGLHYTNRIHTPEQITTLIRQTKPGSPEIARALGRLANACYSLSHGVYSDMNPQLVYDNYGPYIQSNGTLCAIKTFHNLKPTELWPETANIPVTNIDITAVLQGVTMKVDSVTHAIYWGDQINGLKRVRCLGDDRELTISDIDDIRKTIEQVTINVYKQVKSWDSQEKRRMYAWQKAWGYKKLCDAVGMNWHPPESVLRASREAPLFYGWNIPEEKSAAVAFMKNLFSPLEEIKPEAYV